MSHPLLVQITVVSSFLGDFIASIGHVVLVQQKIILKKKITIWSHDFDNFVCSVLEQIGYFVCSAL